jgi:hypothetical protein
MHGRYRVNHDATIECMKQAMDENAVPVSVLADWSKLTGEARLSAEAVVGTCVGNRLSKANLKPYCSCGEQDWSDFTFSNYYVGKEPTRVCNGGKRKGLLCSSQVCVACHMSRCTCQTSHVMSHVTYHIQSGACQ